MFNVSQSLEELCVGEVKPVQPVPARDEHYRDNPNKKDESFKDALDRAKKQREQKG